VNALLDIGQPDIIELGVATDGACVAATVVGAIDQQATHAHVAHLGEGDFGRAVQAGAQLGLSISAGSIPLIQQMRSNA